MKCPNCGKEIVQTVEFDGKVLCRECYDASKSVYHKAVDQLIVSGQFEKRIDNFRAEQNKLVEDGNWDRLSVDDVKEMKKRHGLP